MSTFSLLTTGECSKPLEIKAISSRFSVKNCIALKYPETKTWQSKRMLAPHRKAPGSCRPSSYESGSTMAQSQNWNFLTAPRCSCVGSINKNQQHADCISWIFVFFTPLLCHRSDKQSAGHPDDPGSSHQRPGQRAESAEGQGGADGGREGGPSEPGPSTGWKTETAAPGPGEGACVWWWSVLYSCRTGSSSVMNNQ